MLVQSSKVLFRREVARVVDGRGAPLLVVALVASLLALMLPPIWPLPMSFLLGVTSVAVLQLLVNAPDALSGLVMVLTGDRGTDVETVETLLPNALDARSGLSLVVLTGGCRAPVTLPGLIFIEDKHLETTQPPFCPALAMVLMTTRELLTPPLKTITGVCPS